MTPSNLSNGKERNVDRSPVIGGLVGESELIRQVRQDIEIAASLDLNVLPTWPNRRVAKLPAPACR